MEEESKESAVSSEGDDMPPEIQQAEPKMSVVEKVKLENRQQRQVLFEDTIVQGVKGSATEPGYNQETEEDGNARMDSVGGGGSLNSGRVNTTPERTLLCQILLRFGSLASQTCKEAERNHLFTQMQLSQASCA